MGKRGAWLKSSMIGALGLLTLGCGAENGAPEGATITFNIASLSWSVGAGFCSTPIVDYNDTTVLATVRDQQGNVLNDMDITFALDLSSATSSYILMELYDDETGNGDGIADAGEQVTNPYRTKTKSFGTKEIIVRPDLGGCEYKGYLNVWSGSAFAQLPIDVKNN